MSLLGKVCAGTHTERPTQTATQGPSLMRSVERARWAGLRAGATVEGYGVYRHHGGGPHNRETHTDTGGIPVR